MDDSDVWDGLNDEDFLSVQDDSTVVKVNDMESEIELSVIEIATTDLNNVALPIPIGLPNGSSVSRHKTIVQNGKADSRNRWPKQIPLFKFRYGRLWVSDFSTQLWCEQQMVFTFEPPPAFKKEDLVEPPEVAIGSSLHLVRELEVQDIVEVRVTSKEDRFALKVINLLEAVECLLSGVVTVRREVPVFGMPFEGNIFIFGVIDELRCDSDRMEFEIVEFKTRATKCMPKQAQAKTHNLQVMLYKKLLDDLIKRKLTKPIISKHLNLNLHSPFGWSIASHARRFNAKSLDQLLDACFERLQALPFASSLLVEYAFQGDGSMIGIRQVEYSETWLQEQVDWCLSYWNGRREEIAGVDIEDAWKCQRCPYTAHCPTFAKISSLVDSLTLD